jgi:conjugative transfer region protein TrbK
MRKTKLDGLPMAAAMLLVVFVVAACAIRLRDDETETSSAASAVEASDPLAAKLAECRSVTYDQKDELSECRKAWAEKRRQFLGQKTQAPSDNQRPRAGSPLFVSPKDESRLPSDSPSIQQTGKE